MIGKKELERLCETATPGPWRSRESQLHGTNVDGVGEIAVPVSWCSTATTVGVDGSYSISASEAESNAAFIAAARTAIPELLAENAALQADLEQVCRYLDCTPDNLLDAASKVHRAAEDCERLERENKALQARVQELERDAVRYRKLRRNPAMLLHLKNCDFDAAIDAIPETPRHD